MLKIALLISLSLFLTSCKQKGERDPDVVKFEEQRAELDLLQAELSELRAQSAAAKTKGPKTPVKDLRAKFEKSEAELKSVTEELTKLRAAEEAAVKELAELKAKHLGQ